MKIHKSEELQARIIAKLHVIDQWDWTHSAQFEMYLQRLCKVKKPMRMKTTRGPLHSRRDIIHAPDEESHQLDQDHEE
jgi:hypothetical protein